MNNDKCKKKGKKLRFILRLLLELLPMSKLRYKRHMLELLDVLAAHKEALMMARQDIMLLANRMMKFHGAELRKEQTKEIPDKNDLLNQVEKKPDNNEHMYG